MTKLSFKGESEYLYEGEMDATCESPDVQRDVRMCGAIYSSCNPNGIRDQEGAKIVGLFSSHLRPAGRLSGTEPSEALPLQVIACFGVE